MKTRIKKSLAPISEADAQTALAYLREAEISRQAVTARLNQMKANADAHYASQLKLCAEIIDKNTAIIQAWAEANPLAFGKLKSITWPAGKFGFRTGTPKLALVSRKWNWAGVLSCLKLIKRWIRTIEEVDKESILADYAKGEATEAGLAVLGMKVTQDETFFIEPDLETTDPRQTTTTPVAVRQDKEAA